MEKKNKTLELVLVGLLLVAIAVATHINHSLTLAKSYIDMMEADNEDYVLDVASETDVYQLYHEKF